MAQKKKTEDVHIYQLKIALDEIRPPIWRRIQVKSDMTRFHLHRIIQAIMGWDGYHLHQFRFGNILYRVPHPHDFCKVIDERNVKLSQVITQEKARFVYEYDFGDSWEHKILVEKILPLEADKSHPVCLKGKRACPPEDCGGSYGYYRFLEKIQDPEHPEHKEMLDWVGCDFDPEYFDIDVINAVLTSVKWDAVNLMEGAEFP